MKIINPEKECKITPKNFREESKIISIQPYDKKMGIILNSPEEFLNALMVYINGSVEGSTLTQDDLMHTIRKQGGGREFLSLLSSEINVAIINIANDFIEILEKEVISELKSTGIFRRNFNYEAMGTNLFHTNVDGKRVGNKYVLELNAKDVGPALENKLAEKLGKPRAIVSSSVESRLSVVDDWWFNVNLEDVLRGLPISKKELKRLPGDIASRIYPRVYSRKRPEMTFNYGGQKLLLDIGLDADGYLRPEGKKYGYMQARDKNIVGGAWTTWAENGNYIIAPKVVQPAVVVSVSLPGDEYSRRPVAVTKDQMEVVQGARNYLVELIRATHIR